MPRLSLPSTAATKKRAVKAAGISLALLCSLSNLLSFFLQRRASSSYGFVLSAPHETQQNEILFEKTQTVTFLKGVRACYGLPSALPSRPFWSLLTPVLNSAIVPRSRAALASPPPLTGISWSNCLLFSSAGHVCRYRSRGCTSYLLWTCRSMQCIALH